MLLRNRVPRESGRELYYNQPECGTADIYQHVSDGRIAIGEEPL